MNTIPHIAGLFYNTPLMLDPKKADVISDVLLARIKGKSEAQDQLFNKTQAKNLRNGEPKGPMVKDAYGITMQQVHYTLEGNTAIIPVIGSLVNRGGYIGAQSGLVSYEGLSTQLHSAAQDTDVNSIILDMDSGGGQVTGLFALVDQIKALNMQKPIIAVVNDCACSAAYAIAAACSQIVIDQHAAVGSIGVVMLHMDRSKQMSKAGVKPTFIYAGNHKVTGNALEPLSDETISAMQSDINAIYDQFVASVASNRPMLSDAKIRATEAKVYTGQAALKAGLADSIGTIDSALKNLSSKTANGHSLTSKYYGKGKIMTLNIDNTFTAAQVTEQVNLATATAKFEGLKEGQAIALADIKAIMASDAAKGREKQALALALQGLTPQTAQAVLDVAPKENSLDQRMADNPLPAMGNESANYQPAFTVKKQTNINANSLYAQMNAHCS